MLLTGGKPQWRRYCDLWRSRALSLATNVANPNIAIAGDRLERRIGHGILATEADADASIWQLIRIASAIPRLLTMLAKIVKCYRYRIDRAIFVAQAGFLSRLWVITMGAAARNRWHLALPLCSLYGADITTISTCVTPGTRPSGAVSPGLC